jgi:phosphoserine phosphatase RsbU/P
MEDANELTRRLLTSLGRRMNSGDRAAFTEFAVFLQSLIDHRSSQVTTPIGFALDSLATPIMIAGGRINPEELPDLVARFLNDLDHAVGELRRVCDLQSRITSSSLPEACGVTLGIASQAKLWMSGDFVDTVSRDDWTWIILGDAKAHGPAAAYYANTVIPVLRIFLAMTDSLQEALRLANQMLYEYRPGDEYAVAQVAAWNCRTRELQLSNAGLTVRPIVVKSAIAACVDISGLALAWMPNSEFDLCRFQLLPGDMLVMTSDGIKEQENSSGEQYGEERLRGLVQSHHSIEPLALAQSIISDVATFSSSVISDDETVVVARFS